MQIDGAGLLQEPPHFHQPNGHHDQVGLHALPVGIPGGVDDGVKGRVPVGNLAVPRLVYVVQRPRALERRTGSFGADRHDRHGMVLVGVEGPFQVDEVHGLGVHPPHDVQVVSGPHGPVRPIRDGHQNTSLPACGMVCSRSAIMSRYMSRRPAKPREIPVIWSMVSVLGTGIVPLGEVVRVDLAPSAT